MTTVARSVACSDNGSTLPFDGQAWANQANKEFKGLWNVANLTLANVAGTNTITAQCQIDGVLNAIPAYQDGQEYSLIPVNTTTGPATINIDSKGANSVLDADGNALTSTVCMIAGRTYVLRRISGAFRVRGLTSAVSLIFQFPKNWLSPGGLILSNDAGDTNNYIGISIGSARNSADNQNITLASNLVKKMNFAWVAGTNQGGILQSANLAGTITIATNTSVAGTGTTFSTDFTVGQIITSVGGQSRRITVITSNTAMTVESAWSSAETSVTYKRGGKAKNTTYRVFLLCKDADSTGDVAFSSVSTPTDLPSGYSTYRRIGYVLTDASNNNRQFLQQEDTFTLLTKINDLVSAAYTTTASVTRTSSAPPLTQAFYEISVTATSPGGLRTFNFTVRESAVAMGQGRVVVNLFYVALNATPDYGDFGQYGDSWIPVWLDASAQFVTQSAIAGVSNSVTLGGNLLGWRDPRAN